MMKIKTLLQVITILMVLAMFVTEDTKELVFWITAVITLTGLGIIESIETR